MVSDIFNASSFGGSRAFPAPPIALTQPSMLCNFGSIALAKSREAQLQAGGRASAVSWHVKTTWTCRSRSHGGDGTG